MERITGVAATKPIQAVTRRKPVDPTAQRDLRVLREQMQKMAMAAKRTSDAPNWVTRKKENSENRDIQRLVLREVDTNIRILEQRVDGANGGAGAATQPRQMILGENQPQYPSQYLGIRI
ncbi:hypothetical protein LJC20_04870 [Eubacteriales bacterium OttesenSCG-928-M02]|nr:hypothetical protein [Eubacteriales bacterium OttesenSCG-928-M02]